MMDSTSRTEKMFVGGQWLDSPESMEVTNPANERVIARVPHASADQVADALDRAQAAQRDWALKTGVQRGDVLRRWADLVDEHREHFARTISEEQGKPLNESHGEIDLGNAWFRYYAGFDRRINGEILAADKPNEQLWIFPAPVGVVAGIIPWNYPLGVAIRKIAPALIAGNAIVLKPHEDTPLAALELAKLAEQAGVPAGVVNIVTGPGETVGEAMVRHPATRLITFTGSVATGRRIARLAADGLKLVSLEMGGKAPFIVMDDADLDAAVDAAVFSRFLNCGQVCICNERTYLHQRIAEPFLERFVEKVRRLKVGDPTDPATVVGPKVNRRELDKVEAMVNASVDAGAKLAVGGRRLAGGAFDKGYWFQPTVLTDVTSDMPIMREEIFGPVIPTMTIGDWTEALTEANASRYGLAAYLFTRDIDRIMAAVRDLVCGELYINRGPGESVHGFHTGWKESGIGGDDGTHGLEHYLRRKTVYLKHQA